jgi:predicted AAA+ superfamily ATPase
MSFTKSTGLVERTAGKMLATLAEEFRVVGVTGPRQSGKTTLVRSVFPDLPYVI